MEVNRSKKMNANKLSFESENFQIHYLTLNMQFDNFKRIKKIADYFSNTLVDQLAAGNTNPGIGTRHLFKNIYELRGHVSTIEK